MSNHKKQTTKKICAEFNSEIHRYYIEKVAKVCHSVNKGYCDIRRDMLHPPWEECNEQYRQSIIDRVKFHADNPDATPKTAHNDWVEGKIAEGWRWAPTECARLKLHPLVTDYDNLPFEQRVKDALFISVCRVMWDIVVVS